VFHLKKSHQKTEAAPPAAYTRKKTPKKLPERVPAPSPTTVICLTAPPKTEKLPQPKETHRQQACQPNQHKPRKTFKTTAVHTQKTSPK